MRGLLVAAQASGCGKTAATLGLIAALKARNVPVAPAKAGPDFIDCSWLAAIAGRPALNLDAWMARDEARLVKAVEEFGSGAFLVVEGAMGLYDGPANSSAAALASLLGLPVLLLLNARGMGQSIAALAEGFLGHEPQWQDRPKPAFCGLVSTHTGSPKHAGLLAEALGPVCKRFDVPFLGCLGRTGAPQIPSRHLGLVQASEMELPDTSALARWFSCDLDRLRLEPNPPAPRKTGSIGPGPVIAIARDAAFSFCYADLPSLLESLGARCVFFSPLNDTELPACDGIYLPGGYPELHAPELAANTALRTALAAFRGPIYGECGGYMYLMESLEDTTGQKWPMTGLLQGHATTQKRAASLGYRKACCAAWPDIACTGHEFHYCIADTPSDCQPLWRCADSAGNDLGSQGQIRGNVAGSWVHLYPLGSEAFWRRWLEWCAGQ